MMKLILLFSMLFLFSITAKTQLDQGTWMLGGSGSMYSYNEDATYPTTSWTAKFTSIDLSASIGYFFADQFIAGLRPYLSTYKGESSGGGGANQIRLAVGPFVRYYFLKKDKQFNLLTDISYQLGINQAKDGDRPKGKFNSFSAMVGTELFFNSSVGLELLVGYKNQLATYENSPSAFRQNRKGFLTSIGFHFHLEKK